MMATIKQTTTDVPTGHLDANGIPSLSGGAPAAKPREWQVSDLKFMGPIQATRRPATLMEARCGIFLTPWSGEFEEVFRSWRNDFRLLPLWLSDRRLCTREHIRADLVHLQKNCIFFLIRRRGLNDPIGFVYSPLAALPCQLHLGIHTFQAPGHQRPGHGVAATLMFIRYLFENFSIAKVSSEVCEWNTNSLKSTMHLKQVQLEGIRRNHSQWNGRLYDLYEFGLSREAFQKIVLTSPFWKRLIGD